MDENERGGDNRDCDTGKFSERYDSEEFVDSLHWLGGSGSTKEIADKVGCARRTAYYRLSDLEEEGQVDARKVGKSILWQVIDDDG